MLRFDLGRFYLWFLFVVAILTALARLGLPSQFAIMMSTKLADERKRRRQRLWGWLVLLGSPLILPFGLLYGKIAAWMWVAAAMGVMNGIETLLNTAYPDRPSLTYLSRIFGAFNGLAAVAIWFFVLRYPAIR